MKLKLLFLFLLATFSCFGQQKKAWTIVIYLAANNDLNPYAEPNIQQMMQAGSNDDRNIIIYLAETRHEQKYGKLLRVDKDALVELSCENNIDSGSREICLNACLNAFSEYTAEHNALIFWNHGAGCLNMPFADLFKGIAYDQACDTYLTDRDVLAILQEISQRVFGGKKLDILAFDACLMAGVELQASFAPYVDYYIASEELESALGWDYTKALEPISSQSTAQEVAQAWVSAYDQMYASRNEWYTLSAVNLAKINSLAVNVDTVAKILIHFLSYSQNQSIISFLQESTHPKNITCFDKPENPDYIDLDHLYANLFAKIQDVHIPDNQMQNMLDILKQLLIKGRNLIEEIVVARTAGKRHKNAGGISIYWAQEITHPSYKSLIWTDLYPNWEVLINTYLQFKPDSPANKN